ncbi:unnamed protein product [Dicrocoelium dendriticum]|nr:unnamed protein product [Dicrocoelium dendriticum]
MHLIFFVGPVTTMRASCTLKSTWKSIRKHRHSSIRKDKGLRSDFFKRKADQEHEKRVREIGRKLQEARAARKRAKRLREEENRKRRLENEKRAEVVVPITNISKVKRMKKSQLKTIAKR